MPITAVHIFVITLSQIIYYLPLIYILNKYYLADQNKDAMGGVRGTYEGKGEERVTSRICGEGT